MNKKRQNPRYFTKKNSTNRFTTKNSKHHFKNWNIANTEKIKSLRKKMDFVRHTSASQQNNNKNASQLKAMFNLTEKDGVPGSEVFVESYSGLQPTIRKGIPGEKTEI